MWHTIRSLFFYWLIDFRERRERKRERNRLLLPLLMHSLLVWPWLGIKPATLAHRDSILTSWATWPEHHSLSLVLLVTVTVSLVTLGSKAKSKASSCLDQWIYVQWSMRLLKETNEFISAHKWKQNSVFGKAMCH